MMAKTLKEYLYGSIAPAVRTEFAPAAAPAPTQPIASLAPALTSPKLRSREESIRFIAANAAIALPDGMAAEAIASGQKVDAFAIAVSDHVLAVRAEQERDAEIESLAVAILAA